MTIPSATPAIPTLQLCLIGHGEVGQIFATGLAAQVALPIQVWDIRFAASTDAPAPLPAGNAASSLAQALHGANVVLCSVTADQTLAVAREAAAHIEAGAIYLDLNSASPATKQQCAAVLEEKGARYVEAAVMASVPPFGLNVPMLLGGRHAQAVLPQFEAWGMDVKVASIELGIASAIKMCRSVVIKGMEALLVESYTAARSYGVENEVIASLRASYPGLDWERQGDYFFQRVVAHGKRRSEEMREAAATMAEVGIDNFMAAASAKRQAWLSQLAAAGVMKSGKQVWREQADAILASLPD